MLIAAAPTTLTLSAAVGGGGGCGGKVDVDDVVNGGRERGQVRWGEVGTQHNFLYLHSSIGNSLQEKGGGGDGFLFDANVTCGVVCKTMNGSIIIVLL